MFLVLRFDYLSLSLQPGGRLFVSVKTNGRSDPTAMKLELKCCTGVHKEMVTAVAWTPDNELYSMSDDSTIHRWDGSGDSAGKVCVVLKVGNKRRAASAALCHHRGDGDSLQRRACL